MNLIPNNYSRCSNETCAKKTICLRWLQAQVDKQNSDEMPKSTCCFESKDCEKIIRKH